MLTNSKGKVGRTGGEEVSTLLLENIEGTTETGVDARVLSLILTGRRDEAELPEGVDGAVSGPPCLVLDWAPSHRLGDVPVRMSYQLLFDLRS